MYWGFEIFVEKKTEQEKANAKCKIPSDPITLAMCLEVGFDHVVCTVFDIKVVQGCCFVKLESL